MVTVGGKQLPFRKNMSRHALDRPLVSAEARLSAYDYTDASGDTPARAQGTAPYTRESRTVYQKVNVVDQKPPTHNRYDDDDEEREEAQQGDFCTRKCGNSAKPLGFPTSPAGIELFKMHKLQEQVQVLHTIKWILTGMLTVWLILMLLSVGVLYGGDEFLRKMNDSGFAEFVTGFVKVYTAQWKPYVNTTLIGVADVATVLHAIVKAVHPEGFVEAVEGIRSSIFRLNQTISNGRIGVEWT